MSAGDEQDDPPELSGDDLLTALEVAEILGVGVEWVEAHRWRLACEVTLKDRSLRVRRRDLAAWHDAAKAERVERRVLDPDATLERTPPTRAQQEAMRAMRQRQQTMPGSTPSRWQ